MKLIERRFYLDKLINVIGTPDLFAALSYIDNHRKK